MPGGAGLKAARRGIAGKAGVSARLPIDVVRLEQRAAWQLVQDIERPDGSGWHVVPARDTVAPLAAGPGPVVLDAVPAVVEGAGNGRLDRPERCRVPEFRPDPATAGEIDRAVRKVVFRRVWQIMQEVEEG